MATHLTTLVAASALLAASPAGAEIFKCVAPDGSILFVSEPESCASGAVAPHVPRGAFHSIEREPEPDTPPAAVAPAASPTPAPAKAARVEVDGEEARAAQWKQKRVDAEAELDQISANIDEWDKIATWCNRGGSLAVEDEMGGTQPYDCDAAIEAHAAMSARQQELEHYLETGLSEECRRAECLPGWIR